MGKKYGLYLQTLLIIIIAINMFSKPASDILFRYFLDRKLFQMLRVNLNFFMYFYDLKITIAVFERIDKIMIIIILSIELLMCSSKYYMYQFYW